ncbi:hypothetical protein Tco_0469950, partial [Tanacetum coccineum]
GGHHPPLSISESGLYSGSWLSRSSSSRTLSNLTPRSSRTLSNLTAVAAAL